MRSLRIPAEQALLGSVLLDPAGQQQVLDLVEPGDMYRPWHGQVLSAMQRLRSRGDPPGPLDVYRELHSDPDLPESVARDAIPLADLMEAPSHAGHAGYYAAMVAEGGIRQRLELAGSRLAQAAESGDLDVALRQCAQARRELRACCARWLAIPECLRAELSHVASGAADAEMARRADAVRTEVSGLHEDLRAGRNAKVRERIAVLNRRLAEAAARSPAQASEPRIRSTAPTRPQGAEAEAVGQRALRDLAASPSQIAHVHRWLRPEHFARVEDGDLYAVMRDMDAAGKPVDPVTVTWEAARRGFQVNPANLTGGNAPFAVASARDVHRHGVLAQVATAGRDIQADSLDLTCHPLRLFQSADDRLRALEAAQQPEPLAAPDAQVIAMRRQAGPGGQPRRPGREAVP